VKRLTFNAGYDGKPRWAENGSKIAFVSERNSTKDTYEMDANGSNLEKCFFYDEELDSKLFVGNEKNMVFFSRRRPSLTREQNLPYRLYIVKDGKIKDSMIECPYLTNPKCLNLSRCWTKDGEGFFIAPSEDAYILNFKQDDLKIKKIILPRVGGFGFYLKWKKDNRLYIESDGFLHRFYYSVDMNGEDTKKIKKKDFYRKQS